MSQNPLPIQPAAFPKREIALQILIPLVDEIQRIGRLTEAELHSPTTGNKAVLTIGIPYAPRQWHGRLSAPHRKQLSRAAQRLETMGYVERLSEAGRDRVTHLRPTCSGLAWTLAGRFPSLNVDHLATGLLRCRWAQELCRQLTPQQ